MTTPFSFEFFPPKTDVGAEKLISVHDRLQALNPQYFSVTYGAGGSTRERTLATVAAINGKVTGKANNSSIPVAPHLSCVGDNKAKKVTSNTPLTLRLALGQAYLIPALSSFIRCCKAQ